MGATAEFLGGTVELVGMPADLHDADDVAIFVAEELHDVGAALDVGVFDLGPGNGETLLDGTIDHLFHLGDLGRC